MDGRQRGRGGRRRGPPRRRPQRKPDQNDEELGSKELKIGEKKYFIDIKVNDQGKFVKIVETQTGGVGRLTYNLGKAVELRDVLSKFVETTESMGDIPVDLEEQETIETVTFRANRRVYYCDLRQNQDGRFVKLTQASGPNKYYVYIPCLPSDSLKDFRDALSSLLDEHGDKERAIPPRGPEPAFIDNLPNSREVRAGGKKFYFDVNQNQRGVFIKLAEGRAHINIPHSSWSKMAEVFAALADELPYVPQDQQPREDST